MSPEYVCADCGQETNEQNGPCFKCKSMRIVAISVVEEHFGPNWRDNFDPKIIAAEDFKELELFAWIGDDELGDGGVGIKAAMCNAGFVPLVAKDLHKMERIEFMNQLQTQADKYGKTIRLCRYQFVEEIITVEPKIDG